MKNIFALPFRIAPNKSWFYVTLWIIWFSTLWYLSSRSNPDKQLPSITHIDKVMHFIYFGCGAALVAGFFLSLKNASKFKFKSILLLSLLIGATVGALDEYHQSHTPGRTGNDPWDWAADCLGSIAGAAAMYWGWKKFKNK